MIRLPMARDYSSDLHLFRSSIGSHVLFVDGTRIYDIDPKISTNDDKVIMQLAKVLKTSLQKRIDGRPLTPPPLSSLSLNVAQSCNMSCGYCYADSGKFGGKSSMMKIGIAKRSIDRLITESGEGTDLVLGFMGGEPLLNRKIVHDSTRYASQLAKQAGRNIRFSLTTNATLINKEDARLFSEFPFSISISIDGTITQHDYVRKMNDGSSSYSRIINALEILNSFGRPRHLSARVTVTPLTGPLLPILDHLIDLGFDEVGFAPVLVSPIDSLTFSSDDFKIFLNHMIKCAQKAMEAIIAKQSFPFSNFETALMQIHRGTHHPYPCGAGAAYLSVNTEGKLFACHRLIDDDKFFMGDLDELDMKSRSNHLVINHVDNIEPCNSCWARYMCGGGCYHEVSRRGRIGCDYIRDWLDFCLKAYVELSARRPEYFESINNDEFLNNSATNSY